MIPDQAPYTLKRSPDEGQQASGTLDYAEPGRLSRSTWRLPGGPGPMGRLRVRAVGGRGQGLWGPPQGSKIKDHGAKVKDHGSLA
jgi:hypothetical protein